MKKTLLITLIAVVFLFILVLLIPVLFKGTLLERTKATLNRNLNAKIEFSDFRLSLLKSFPKITIELKNVVITGKNEFKSDTLLSVPTLRSGLKLFSLFQSGSKTIEEIQIDNASLNLIVGSEGQANWDIASAEETGQVPPSTEQSSFGLKLSSVRVKDARVAYIDKSIGMDLLFNGVNLDLSGDMYGSVADLNTTGTVDKFSLDYDSVTYLSGISLKTTARLKIDYEKIDISILENEFFINKLPLEILGDIKMPNDSIWIDLNFKTKTSDFRNFLELVPPDYESYLKGVNATGSASASGTIKGWYTDYEYPMTDIRMLISDGRIKYNDLPEEIKNIKASILLKKPQGDLDKTIFQIKEAHAEIRNNPVDLTFLATNLTSDLFFDGAFVGKVNFNNLKEALPIDSLNLSGTVDANLFVKGNYSAIEKEQYENVAVDGIVLLSDFIFEDKGLTQAIRIPSGNLDFSPSQVNLKELIMRVGESDFTLKGSVSEYLNYLFKEGTLQGNMNLNSSYINLNQLMTLEATTATDPAKKAEKATENKTTLQPFNIPGRINFTFRSDISKALFENLTITNINGLIRVNDGKLNLEGLRMNMLDGELKLAGSYKNNPRNMPEVDFGFDILNFDIPLAFQSLTSVQRMFPVAGNARGRLSTNFKMAGQFSPEMKLVSSTVDGLGLFSTKDLHILDSPVFDQVKGILNKEKLKDIKVDDFTANFTIENGNLLLKPFKTRVAGQETTIFGSLNPQNILDMKMDFVVAREAFGPDIQAFLGILPGQENITQVPASVLITGPVNNPSVKLDLSKAKKEISTEVKKSTKEGIQKSLNKLGEGLKKLIK